MKRLNIALHPELARLRGTLSLTWSKHAIAQAVAKNVPSVASLDFSGRVVEAEVADAGGRPLKLVVRVPIRGTDRDAVYVVVPLDAVNATVVTAWTNARSDTHKTLDKSRLSLVPRV